MKKTVFLAVSFCLWTNLVIAAKDAGRIYGRVVTKEGQVYQGLIRWGSNEASHFDLLDGSKRMPERNREVAERAGILEEKRNREVRFLGYKIFEWDEGEDFPSVAQSGIRFGHIQRIEPLSRSRARLILKSGEEVVLQGSVDIGSGIRKVIIEDPSHGKKELDWDEIDVVEFLEDDSGQESEFGSRLYGTLVAAEGAGFTGFISWDVDEILSEDVLDGDVDGEKRRVKFGDISSIERADSRSAWVTPKSGARFRMSGSNDVNKDNRDILVVDPGLGQVRVEWEEFSKVVFLAVPADLSFRLDGGHLLKGTVRTESGDAHTGTIRWDNDEEYSWEILDGEYRGLDFDVELGLVQSIEKKSRDSSVVTLLDGRTFELEGSNDVDSGNKGIFVTLANGEEIAIRWNDFNRVEFEHSVLAERPFER